MRNEMKKIVFLIICLSVFLNDVENRHHRVKRKVLFTKNSKLFFRLNGKDNVIPWNQIFAHGWAFRVNWDLPEALPRRQRFFKREIHDELEGLKMIQGYSCILKYLCEFIDKIKSSKTCGVFCKIGNIVSRSKGIDAEFFQTLFEKCSSYIEDCPYSFQEEFYTTYG